jgi:hypothetical protein
MSIVGPAKMAVDGAATAAGKLDAWGKSAEQALNDGKELNLFEDAIRGIKFFGQANAALQCLSMGLTALGMLMGDKSQEAQILDGIDQILGRIKTLTHDVNTRFDELSNKLNIQTGTVELQPYMVTIEAAESYLSQISIRKANGQDFSLLENDLATKFNTTDFVKAMDQINDSCVGAGTVTSPNILIALYQWSYGDIRQVWPVGEYLLQKAASALMLHGIVEGLQSKRNNKTFDASQIAGLYEDKIQAVAAAVEKCATDCTSPTERPKNIRRYLDEKKSPLRIDADDKQGTSSRIADSLQGQYPYLNFSVIAYDPVSDFYHHGVTGQNYLAEFRYLDTANKPINLIIYWANYTKGNRQARITYQSAVVDWHHFPGPRKDRSFDTATFNSWPNRPPGSRYQFVFDLSIEANKATNNSVFGEWWRRNKDLSPVLNSFNNEQDSAKREPDSMIWFCWADNYQDAKQSNIGMTSYNAMYGVVAPYTAICFWKD